MDVGQYPRKVLDPSDPLGPTRSENLRQWIDPRGSDADVVHRHTRVVGLLDGVCGVRPGITALVALIRNQAIPDDDQQTAFGGLRQ
jgi:hypothetical protein